MASWRANGRHVVKSTFMAGASALAFILAMPDMASAAPAACGVPDVSADPNVVSCVSDPAQFAQGITYNQSDYATPAGIKIDLYGTAVVAPTANPNAVTVIGSPDHVALIGARAGSRITAAAIGLLSQTTGTGAATVDSHGAVAAGTAGLMAVADTSGGAGLASVLNEADGSVTLTLPSTPAPSYALVAQGGSANVVNNGIVSVTNATTGGGPVFGLAGASYASGGTATLSNTNAVTLTGTGASYVGIGTTASSGQVSLTSSGALGVSTQSGNATGFSVANAGTAGATTLTNSGVLSVSTQNSAGGASATGMDVEQGTSVTLVSQRSGGTGGFAVAGGAATGFLVQNASGSVDVTNSGQVVQVSGDTAVGVRVTSGATETVSFADAVIGGTAYKGDLTVNASGAATGMSLAGATGAVAVDFTGAALSAVSTGTNATGVAITGGTSVRIDTAANASSGNGAAVTVNAAGGTATGISVLGASAAETVTIGDAFTVSNSGGAAAGINLDGGTSQSVSLAQGASITGVGAVGVQLSDASAAMNVTSADLLSVNGGAGGATAVALGDGTSQTVDLARAVTVQASGGAATGLLSTGAAGAVQLTMQDALSVTNSAGSATAISVGAGTDETVSLAAGLQVQGSTGASGVALSGTGALGMTSAQDFTVTSSGGDALGAAMHGGASQDAAFNAGVQIQGAGSVIGISQTGAAGAVSLTVAGAFGITGGAGGTTGVYQSGGTTQTVNFGGDLSVAAAGGSAYGVQLADSTDSGSVTANAGFTVKNNAGSAVGVAIAGANTTALLGQGLTVSGAGGEVIGVDSTAADDSAVTVKGPLAVTNDPAVAGTAIGIRATAGTSQTASVAGPITVSAQGDAGGVGLSGTGTLSFTAGDVMNVKSDAGSALGVALAGGTSQSATLAKAVTVGASGDYAYGLIARDGGGAVQVTFDDALDVANAGGMATAVQMMNGTTQTLTLTNAVSAQATGGDAVGIGAGGASGLATVHLPTTVSATSDTGAAYGIQAVNGGGLLVDGGGSLTASAGGNAYGLYSSGQTGAQAVTLADVTATSTDAVATGVALGGSDAISLISAGTIAASSTGTGGAGVVLQTSGANAAINATLNNVVTSGDGTLGVAFVQANGSGTISATVNNVTTTGNNAVGVSASGSQSGGVTLTLGQVAQAQAAVPAQPLGGVTTQGDGAIGVLLAVQDGAGTITNNGTIATSGSAATGIAASSTGSGPVTIDSWNVTSTGAGADGIAVSSGTGAQSITARTVTVSGAGANGITAISDSGAITIDAGTVTAQQASGYAIGASSGSGALVVTSANASATGADAIHLTSVSGDVSVTLADSGTTNSAAGAGLFVDTGGSATINLGTTATSAVLHGATVGLSSHAAAGQVIILSGEIGADDNLAVALTGGPTTLLNKGVINGYMTLATDELAFTNAGSWNAYGGNSIFGAGATLTNSGTINVFPSAAGATTLKLAGLDSFHNSGTISLVNGHVGDVLDLGGASFIGAGGSRVVLEANLGGSAVNGNAPQTSDQLVVGAASGVTTIAIKDVSAAQAAQFNFSGIRVVDSTSATAGAFVLDGGSINKGFAEYRLMADGSGNFDLVSVPSIQAFELVRTGAEIRKYWRRSADTWAEQMRNLQPHQGFSSWGQLYGGGETSKSRPVYMETVLGSATAFAPDLDVRDSWTGGQLGLDWGRSNWSLGVTGGYLSQDGRVEATGDRIKLDGGNIGLYARYQATGGFFIHALAKVDRVTVKYKLGGSASVPNLNSTSYGIDIEAGYHLRIGMAFLEPELGLAWSHSNLDGIRDASGGIDATFEHLASAFGHAGLRGGIETHSGNWTIKPYLGAAWESELNGRPGVTLSSGGTDLYLGDTSEGGRARLEAGIQGDSEHGLSAFAKVEGVTGEKVGGISGRAGIALHW
jgi:hypothetical protein